MIKSLLFSPAVLGFVALTGAPSPEGDHHGAPMLVVAGPERPPLAADGDQFAGLRGHLASLNESLQHTRQAVETMARQRDEAREEVTRSHHQIARALKELDRMQKKLAAAREETARWRDKAETTRMTREDLQRFRGELQGAIAGFQDLKGDFAKARSELNDPIERVEMKKALSEVEREHERLKSEIEIALKARNESKARAEKVRKDWQEAMARSKELETRLGRARAEVGTLKERVTNSMAGQEDLARELRKAQARAGELDKELAALKADLKEREAKMAEVPKVNETLAKELESTKSELDRVRSELGFLHKSKGGLEELLFKKTAEIRELKGQLRKAGGREKPGDADKQSEVEGSESLSGQPIPRAIIVYEG